MCCYICVRNINTKYSFVRELPYTSEKDADSAWRPNNENILKVPGSAKSSAKGGDARIKILQDMRGALVFKV